MTKKDNKYKYLEKQDLYKLYDIYYKNKRKLIQNNENDESYRIMQMIREIIENKMYNKDELERIEENNKYYLSYPDINDPNFEYKLSKKAEFFHCKSLLNRIDLEQKCFSKDFELGNHQQFLRGFMNQTTPYRGLLIFHGVGVGKTCSAVTISNSFREMYKNDDKKIICLVSKNIQSNWRNTIYDPNKGDNQCTGNSFENLIGNVDGIVEKGLKGRVKKTIKKYYEFYGYQQFANKIKKMIKNRIGNRTNVSLKEVEKSVIRKYFSDRLLIIDEVHNLRDDNITNKKDGEGPSKDTIKYLDKIVKYSENMRLVLMSATPMFNKPSEIIWLLNLLLKNDKRLPITIKPKDLFQQNGELTKTAKEIITHKCKGYISYLRGENPITFPIRILPDDYNDKNFLDEYPIYDIWDEEYNFSKIYQFKFLKMYYSEMDGYQNTIYHNFIDTLTPGDKIQMTDRGDGKQISNIVYPSIEMLNNDEDDDFNYKKMYSKKGLNNLMDVTVKNRSIYSYKEDVPPLFSLDYLGLISTKIYTILTGLKQKKSKGIIFIYSEYLSSGAVPLALALEHMGFEKYSGNHLNYPEWKKGKDNTKDEPIDYQWNPISKKKGEFKRAKYIILSGDKGLSPNNDDEISALVSDKNKNGENIKIVIGSVVASEGLDLKNIREIHILDPWYHLYRIEQIIGRGIRFCSHINLPKEERNVTIFLHVALLSKERESIDTYIYRNAEEKANLIGSIETVLKQNSIDCFLNRQINIIQPKDILPIRLKTSRNKILKSFEVHDKNYSKVCSFSRTCNYSCGIESINKKDINYDTFTFENSKTLFQTIHRILKELFELNNYYTLYEIEKIIMELIDTNQYIIYHALNDMIENKITIWNKYNISGYLINKDDYYLFQPHNNGDIILPLYYRNNNVKERLNTHISLEGVINKKKKQIKTQEKEKEKYKIIDIDYLYKILKQKSLKKKLIFGKHAYPFEIFIEDLDMNIYFEYYLDLLSYQEKTALLKDVVKEYIETKKHNDKIKKLIFNYFERNLIKQHKGKYYLFENKKYDIIGFFLYNTDKLYDKKDKNKKELDQIENDYDYYLFDEQWNEINNLEDGLLIKRNLFMNKDKIIGELKTSNNYWGFSFKDKEKHVLKFVNQKKVLNKIPGKVIETNPKNMIKKLIETNFPDSYEKYNDFLSQYDEKNKHIKFLQSKDFYSLLIEMILRNKEKKILGDKHIFIPYDIVLLKYLN